MSDLDDDIGLISSSIELANGVIIPNRLVKAAMEEGIAHWGGLPGPSHRRLYRVWGSGGWGVIVTGNVQVDPRHLATPHDRSFPDHSPSTIAAFAQLHSAILSGVPPDESPPLTLVQLSHPGLQSSSTLGLSRAPWSPAVAATAARPDMGPSALGWLIGRVMWPRKSRVLSTDEWVEVVDMFVQGARTIEEAGWGGVQVHSAHGYLLASYLSPLTNPSPSEVPGVPSAIPARLHLLYLILNGIKERTRPEFVISVKINCSDFVQGGLDEAQAVEVVKELVSWKMIDLLEISGGTYASPAFATPETMRKKCLSISPRQSLFAQFTTSLLPNLPPPPEGPAIILTGGLHDRDIIATSLRDRACDLVGIGRPACIQPRLPREVILNRNLTEENTQLGGYDIPGAEGIKSLFGGRRVRSIPSQAPPASYLDGEPQRAADHNTKPTGIPLVGAGVSTLWHEWQMCRIGRGVEPDVKMNWIWGGLLMELLWFGILKGATMGWLRGWTGREQVF